MRVSLHADIGEQDKRAIRPLHVVRSMYFPPCWVNNTGLRSNSFYFDVGGYCRGGACLYRIKVRQRGFRRRDLRIIPFTAILATCSYWTIQEFSTAGEPSTRIFLLAFVFNFSLLVFAQVRADAYLGPYLMSSIANGFAQERSRESVGVATKISARATEDVEGVSFSHSNIAFAGRAGTDSRKTLERVLSVTFYGLSIASVVLAVMFAVQKGQVGSFFVPVVFAFFLIYILWPALRHSAWTGVRGFEEKTSSERRAWQGFDGPSELRIYEDRLEHLWEEQFTTIQRERIVRIERHDPRERWWWLKPACLRVVLLDDEDREAHYILLDVDPSDEELAQLNEWARGNAPDERAGGDAGSATMSEALDRLEDEYLG